MDTISPMAFWDKVRRTAGKLPFLDQAVAIWFCARDPATPLRVRMTLLGAIAYFVMPFDVLPDLLAGLGYTDDLAVITAAVRAVLPHITEAHRAKARAVLESRDFPS